MRVRGMRISKGDDTSTVGNDPHPSEGDAASPAGDTVSPTGDLLASLNLGICDTTHADRAFRVQK
jgi:hypothetical protein